MSNNGQEHKIIVFVHINKTAGTTLKWILRNNFGLSHCDSAMTKTPIFNQDRLNFAKKIFVNLKSIAGHNLIEPTKNLQQDNLLLVTLLRDPVKRVVSHHQDSILRGNVSPQTTIEEALDHGQKKAVLSNLATTTIAGEPNAAKAIELLDQHYDLVGLTKHFDKTAEMLQKLAPYPIDINYTRRIVAKDNTIKKKILSNDNKIEEIKKYNQEDLKLYDFAEKQLFPKFLDKLGESTKSAKTNYDTFNSRNQPCYLRSKFYNKYVYRQIMKIRRKFLI